MFGTFDVSPDGKRLAIEVFGVETHIYVIDIAEGSLSKLTVEGANYSPVWTPDGRQIAFWSSRRGKSGIYMKHVDRHRDADLLSEVNGTPNSWSPDGTVLVYTNFGSDEGGIWFLDRDGRRTLFLETPYRPWGPAFSPDGRWIAYTSSRTGQYQVYVRPYSPGHPEEDRVWQISQDFGEEPVWSPLGDRLFYRQGDQWMSVSVSTEPEFVAHPPEPAFSGNYRNVRGRSYDISPDGERFLVLVPDQRSANVTQIRVVQNWFEELNSKVPLGGN
jgi:Tol biopolymer transport system component